MTKVYVVTSGCYSDYDIDSIWSTKKKAQDYIDFVNRYSEAPYKINNYIKEHILDEPEKREYETTVYMEKNGNVVDTTTRCDTWHSAYPISFISDYWSFEHPEKKDVVSIHVMTHDKERAIKVANEKRAAILAMNLWGTEDYEKLNQLIK